MDSNLLSQFVGLLLCGVTSFDEPISGRSNEDRVDDVVGQGGRPQTHTVHNWREHLCTEYPWKWKWLDEIRNGRKPFTFAIVTVEIFRGEEKQNMKEKEGKERKECKQNSCTDNYLLGTRQYTTQNQSHHFIFLSHNILSSHLGYRGTDKDRSKGHLWMKLNFIKYGVSKEVVIELRGTRMFSTKNKFGRVPWRNVHGAIDNLRDSRHFRVRDKIDWKEWREEVKHIERMKNAFCPIIFSKFQRINAVFTAKKWNLWHVLEEMNCSDDSSGERNKV